MAPDAFTFVWNKFGLLGFMGYVMVREVWPFVRDRVWPARMRALKVERERMSKLEERQAAAEDRQVVAIEAMGNSVHEMTVAITTNNERLSTLIAGHTIHTQDTTAAIALMRERTSTRKRL